VLNNIDEKKFEEILLSVQQPAHYICGELNSIVKDHDRVDMKFALAFPDTYAIGMSHLGMAILYHILNQDERIACERVFSPRTDFEAQMRGHGIPLYTLETKTPVRDFDVVGFSLQYEMSYTTVLNMLELSGIKLFSADRRDEDPIVVAGGPCALNGEPLADFIDVFFLGDAEENLPLFCRKFIEIKKQGGTKREEFLREIAANVPGAYVPSLYEERYDGGRFKGLFPAVEGIPGRIEAQAADISQDFSGALRIFPTSPIIPYVETVHDRISIEIMRGCPNRCRFCFSKFTKDPVRIRKPETIIELAKESYANTGHREISLLSLSTGNYPKLGELIEKLNEYFRDKYVSVSVPSLRVDKELAAIPSLVSEVRKSALTIALEAGTDRLRGVIDKRITNEAFFEGVEEAYRKGWDTIKLYFMVGLPTEGPEDLKAAVEIIKKTSRMRKSIKGAPAKVNATISPFIPKPFTPFQWEAMRQEEYFREARDLLFSAIPRGKIRLKFHNYERSFLEAVFARGDRKLSRVLLEAHKRGCRLDGWEEHFDYSKWRESFEASGIDPAQYTANRRPLDAVFPWSHIDVGFETEKLKGEYKKAFGIDDRVNSGG